MKYKPCCKRRCALGVCEIRDKGGCSCVCALKDQEREVISILDGNSLIQGTASIYMPGRNIAPVGEQKQKLEKALLFIGSKIKRYEIE